MKRTRQPARPARADRASALARGLIILTTGGPEQGNTLGQFYNAVRQAYGTVNGSPSGGSIFTNTRLGAVAQFHPGLGANGIGSIDWPLGLTTDAGDLTVFWSGILDNVSGNGQMWWRGKATDSFRTVADSTSIKVSHIDNAPAQFDVTLSGLTIAAGDHVSMVAIKAAAAAGAVTISIYYVNHTTGARASTSSSPAGAVSTFRNDTAKELRIGVAVTSDESAHNRLLIAAAWTRALLDAEAWAVIDSRWQLYAPIPAESTDKAAAGGGAATAALDVTLDAATAAATASAPAAAGATPTLAALAVNATAAAAAGATAAPTLDALTVAATAAAPATASASPSLDAATLASAAAAPVAASSTPTLDPLTAAGTAAAPAGAAATPTLDAVVVSATATVPTLASAAPTLDAASLSGTATTPVVATATPTLDPVALSASVGQAPALADAAIALEAVGVSAQASAPATANASPTLGGVSLSATAQALIAAAGSLAIGPVTLSAQAVGPVVGSASIALAPLTLVARVAEPVTFDYLDPRYTAQHRQSHTAAHAAGESIPHPKRHTVRNPR